LSSAPPRVTLIAALAANRVIGRKGALPWHIPEDLKRFKSLTLGHPVVMGRKTFDSIFSRLGKPLPGRRNMVISRSMKSAVGVEVFGFLQAALDAVSGGEEIFVIGGEQIYELALPLAQRLELTEVREAVDGDAWFPAFDRNAFVEVAREKGAGNAALPYDFVTYERKRSWNRNAPLPNPSPIGRGA
jgi:dihydrofolate reductase